MGTNKKASPKTPETEFVSSFIASGWEQGGLRVCTSTWNIIQSIKLIVYEHTVYSSMVKERRPHQVYHVNLLRWADIRLFNKSQVLSNPHTLLRIWCINIVKNILTIPNHTIHLKTFETVTLASFMSFFTLMDGRYLCIFIWFPIFLELHHKSDW